MSTQMVYIVTSGGPIGNLTMYAFNSALKAYLYISQLEGQSEEGFRQTYKKLDKTFATVQDELAVRGISSPVVNGHWSIYRERMDLMVPIGGFRDEFDAEGNRVDPTV